MFELRTSGGQVIAKFEPVQSRPNIGESDLALGSGDIEVQDDLILENKGTLQEDTHQVITPPVVVKIAVPELTQERDDLLAGELRVPPFVVPELILDDRAFIFDLSYSLTQEIGVQSQKRLHAVPDLPLALVKLGS